ncbi:MAG TPA: hypothetical protein VNM67_18405 [Thermoanaerobaculia bacterium]|jgi:bacteriocin-like protein|nr:hypothetical protein [Thermoanaerobaculia bacterium]
MSEEKKDQQAPEEKTDFVFEPLSDEELEDVSGGGAPDGCTNGSGCCDGSHELVEA